MCLSVPLPATHSLQPNCLCCSTHEEIVTKWKKTYKGFDCGVTNCAEESKAGGASPSGDWAKVVLWKNEEL